MSTRRCEAYGEKHLQTVKAITMIALLERKLGREEKGIEWYRKELRIREKLQATHTHTHTEIESATSARRLFPLRITVICAKCVIFPF